MRRGNKMRWIDEAELTEYKERGFETSKTLFDSEEEATEYVSQLKELDREVNFVVSVAGFTTYMEDYIQVVYKISTTNS
jgi:hypothetical protein